jgi:predicted ATPase
MIESISLKFGRIPGASDQKIKITPVTVFVGPNNSGKSKVLQELLQFLKTGTSHQNDVLLRNIEFETLLEDQILRAIEDSTLRPSESDRMPANYLVVGKRGSRNFAERSQLYETFRKPNVSPDAYCAWYLSFNTMMLDGPNRIGLISQQAAGDLQELPRTSLQTLFQDDARRAQVRNVVYNAFKKYFTVDPTNIGYFRIRLNSRPPMTNHEERGIDDDAKRYHAAGVPIERMSDGVKAFTGMITELIAGDPLVLLIDEPEAFLHPSLAFTLGKEIGLATAASQKRLFVSTHSPNFVMGCLQSKAPINIVRLTYQDPVATSRVLPSAEILRLMRNPLLRSTGILSALFYEHVVVTESDTDRAFYQEINERLLQEGDLGIPNCLFVNAQNKQTVRMILRPLRELGIPVAAIVDIDVVKEGGAVWTEFLSSGYIPNLEQGPLGVYRKAVKQKMESSGKEMKTEGGIQLLEAGDREAANNLFDRLGVYGLFVVRNGELESWLKSLGVGGHGPRWLTNIFEVMGEDPESERYVRPGQGDVWGFLATIKRWLSDPNRKGIPA